MVAEIKNLYGKAADNADRYVLALIGGGILLLLESIILAVTLVETMEDWAESIFAVIAGGAIVKLADVLSTLVALASNRQVSRMSDQLSEAVPLHDPDAPSGSKEDPLIVAGAPAGTPPVQTTEAIGEEQT